MKIGLLLGSFNPFTNAHHEIADKVLKLGLCDKVLIVVAKQNPWKENYSVAFDLRLLMCKEATRDLSLDCIVSDIERNMEGVAYSYKTLTEVRKKYSEDTFSLIVGDDVIERIEEWKNFKDDILPYVDFIRVRRDASIDDDSYSETCVTLCGETKKVYGIGVKNGTLSSTKVRDAIKNGKPFQWMVNGRVFDIINENKLYLQE